MKGMFKNSYLSWAINPIPGERILISGNKYAYKVLNTIDKYCREKGAILTTHLFSNEDIMIAVKSLGQNILRTFWIPLVIDEQICLFKGEKVHFDKIIILFTNFMDALPESFNDQILAIEKHNLDNLHNYSKYQIKTVLVEYPIDQTLQKIYDEGLNVNYHQMSSLNKTIMHRLHQANKVTITCPLGSHLEMIKGNRPLYNEDCSFSSDHLFQLPGGEVFFAPIEDSTNGCIYIQGQSLNLGHAIELIVHQGHIISIQGDYNSETMNNISQILGVPDEIIGEFGIGTNPNVSIKSSCSLYEKKLHTVHVGVGENIYYGGCHKSERHIDLVIENPTIYADDKIIINSGQFCYN